MIYNKMDKPNKNKIVKVTVLVMLMIFSINLVSAELDYSTGEAIYGTLADGTPDYGGVLTTYDGIDFTYSNVGTLAYIKPRINPSNYESELIFGLLNDILKIQSTGISIIGDIHINDNYKSLYGTGKDTSETFTGTARISNAEVGTPEYNWTNYSGYNFKDGNATFENNVKIEGDLNVTGNIKAIGNINASSLNAQNGFSGDCVNTTYSGGIAISCND